MNGAFHVGAIGLQAQQRALDTIANNISNVNTTAFKRSDVRFSEIIAGKSDGASLPASLGPAGNATAGVVADPMFMIDQAGRIEATGNGLDLALDGAGFIEVMAPGGQTLLWRGGALKIGEDGLLATRHGLPLKAAITVPVDASGIEINPDGLVKAILDGGEKVEIGQITLTKTADQAPLERLDGGLYRPDDTAGLIDSAPGEDGVGTLVQGALERSNVELTSEMVQLVLIQRAYAANAQVVQAADQLMAIANGLKR